MRRIFHQTIKFVPPIVLSLVLCVLQLAGSPQQTQDQNELAPFMQMKLQHSKDILEGLATEDFEKIAVGAQALTALSLESSWNVYTTGDYLQHSSDFRRSLGIVKDAAQEKNIDRAALGFIDLTVQCLECHRYLRKQIVEKDLEK